MSKDDRITENIKKRIAMTPIPDKARSEWQYIPYRCDDCGHEGECKVRIGEYLFCGNCGSQFLLPPPKEEK